LYGTRRLPIVSFGRLMPPLHVIRRIHSLAQSGCWVVLAIAFLLTLGTSQFMMAQTTIQVTTTQQGVTDDTALAGSKPWIRRLACVQVTNGIPLGGRCTSGRFWAGAAKRQHRCETSCNPLTANAASSRQNPVRDAWRGGRLDPNSRLLLEGRLCQVLRPEEPE